MKRTRGNFEGNGARAGGEEILFEVDVDGWYRSSNSSAPGLQITEPKEVAYFSRDGDRTIHYGSRHQLATFREPILKSNLARNMQSFREKRKDDGVGVEPVVKALANSNTNILQEGTDVVTFRNNLNKISGTPYNGRDAWEMDAVNLDGITFLDVRKLDENRPESDQQRRFMYMGYYFESLCTGAENEPVDANSEFCSLIKLRLGNHRISFAAEIDCEKAGNQNSNADEKLKGYVELKTMRQPSSAREESNMFKFRFMKYWIQSYLAGVRTVVVGMRDDAGFLRHVEHFDTISFPSLVAQRVPRARNGAPAWDPNVILNFLDHTITQIRRVCASEENIGCNIRIRYEPNGKKITAWKVQDSDFPVRISAQLNEINKKTMAQ